MDGILNKKSSSCTSGAGDGFPGRLPLNERFDSAVRTRVFYRLEAANVSDRRVGARLLGGLQSGFPWIRTVMADAGTDGTTNTVNN
jgi:hypothetical protein